MITLIPMESFDLFIVYLTIEKSFEHVLHDVKTYVLVACKYRNSFGFCFSLEGETGKSKAIFLG